MFRQSYLSKLRLKFKEKNISETRKNDWQNIKIT